jgi:hypothetical protein
VEQDLQVNDEQESDSLEYQNDEENANETDILDEIVSPENETDNSENNSETQDNLENRDETSKQEEQKLGNEQENMDENLELKKNQEPIVMEVVT